MFNDVNANGFKESGESGIPSIPVTLSYTDGSLYGATATDGDGNYVFPQYTSWWRYLVTGVDFARFKPTGMTAYVDDGGPLPSSDLGSQGLNPQTQPDGKDHRTETGLVVTEAIQTFQDMTNVVHWGKTAGERVRTAACRAW